MTEASPAAFELSMEQQRQSARDVFKHVLKYRMEETRCELATPEGQKLAVEVALEVAKNSVLSQGGTSSKYWNRVVV